MWISRRRLFKVNRLSKRFESDIFDRCAVLAPLFNRNWSRRKHRVAGFCSKRFKSNKFLNGLEHLFFVGKKSLVRRGPGYTRLKTQRRRFVDQSKFRVHRYRFRFPKIKLRFIKKKTFKAVVNQKNLNKMKKFN